MDDTELRTRIRAIMQDASLSETEKSEARQKLMMPDAAKTTPEDASEHHSTDRSVDPRPIVCTWAVIESETEEDPVEETLKCTICLSMCDRPVTVSAAIAFRSRGLRKVLLPRHPVNTAFV